MTSKRASNSARAPDLHPFGLVLHHNGRWTHEGGPILNRRLREKFDRSVHYVASEDKFVVEVGRFRGEIEVEEAAFFVRNLDLKSGSLTLSDGTCEHLNLDSLHFSSRDGALLCLVSRPGARSPVLARFDHAPHAELLLAVDETPEGLQVQIGGALATIRGLRDLP